MDIRKIGYATLRGLFDSIKGIFTVFYLDKEINTRNAFRQSPTRTNSIVRQRNVQEPQARVLKKQEESKVGKRIFQCSILNGGIFLLSILLFEYGLLPCINMLLAMIFGTDSFMGHLLWSWIQPILSLIFQTVWVIPLFLLSKVVNALWFQDIADLAYRHSRGRPVFAQSISKMIADAIFSIVIQLLFLVQATAANYIPIHVVGFILSNVQMCLLYSLYAFEYKWFNMGWELHKRLAFIEINWPYFIGFGLPLTISTQLSDSWIVSACIFSIMFPFFIISGNEASPVTNSCDIPLHFFSPVICVSNCLFSKTMGMPKKPPMTPNAETINAAQPTR